MVLYFESDVVSPPVKIFMGNDKYENEDLIKWGWPEDVWFHVDKLSSAHVYLRLSPGQTLDDIPTAVLEDAAQLVKANSISGNKSNDIDVVYTMWSNLKKTPGMDVGQVGFYREKDVRRMKVVKRQNEIVKRLNRTKVEELRPDLETMRRKRDQLERDDRKQMMKQRMEQEKDAEKKRREDAELRSYSALMSSENMNKYDDGNDSDDFM